ncbi:MAG TPA: hypothetical protein VNB24_10250 [Acidimicrobiales bacterium]|nr:hypothetical protein [Acidimicrobiales bacterium]
MTGPQLRTGVEFVALPDGVVIVNAGPPVRFRGRAAIDVLRPVLGALDGTLTPPALADQLELKPAHVERALGILREHDLLEP